MTMKRMARFWLSWPQPTKDYRPLTDPPVTGVLGWWCSGYDSEDRAVLCALVAANTVGAAKSLVRQSWPEAPARRASWRIESEQAVNWLSSNYYKTALELGHCLRLPEEGPCECDLFLTCSKFFTTAEYQPRLQERLCLEQRLAEDAAQRGWPREVERHNATAKRIAGLLDELAPRTR